MFRSGLALILLLASTPLTSLTVEAPEPSPLAAGEPTTIPVTVQLEGPTGRIPGLAGPVDLTLSQPPAAGCQLSQSSVLLDPVTGQATVPLACRPDAPGQHGIRVQARSPPHQPGSWTGNLTVRPDTLVGGLSAGEPDGYQIPLRLNLSPMHLDAADVQLELSGELAGSPLGFSEDPVGFRAEPGASWQQSLLARHGPGTYNLTLVADGPTVEPIQAGASVDVPEPPSVGQLDLNVTVEPGQPSVTLSPDAVNDDGKNKTPGETLITRLETQHAAAVNVTVLRRPGNQTVPIAVDRIPVDDQGDAEHTFTEPVLPTGLLTVQATAGNSSVARTAHIRDAAPDAMVHGPAEALADGRVLAYDVELRDPNFGSTPLDPGPVWGLPNVTWRVFHGSHTVTGWNVSLGPWTGGPEGQAATSRIPWPMGAPGVQVGTGWAKLEARLDPPDPVDTGTYRLSLYAPDGDRLGGASVDLAPIPELSLGAPVPSPGQPWPVDVQVDQPVANTTVNLTIDVDGRTIANRTLGPGDSPTIELPRPLEAGLPVHVQAQADWPGRPAPDEPDARIETTVPELGPRLTVHPSLDGVPVQPPVPAHPAGNHTLHLNPRAVDPNGDPIEITTQVIDPSGSVTNWTVEGAPSPEIRVPAGAAPGRYQVVTEAKSPDGVNRSTIGLDVGRIARVALAGPVDLTLAEGEVVETNLTVENAGTVPLAGLLVDLEAPPSLDVELRHQGSPVAVGEPVPVELPRGGEQRLTLRVSAGADARGQHALTLGVAGVLG